MLRTLFIIGLLATSGTQAAAQSLVGKWDCNGREGRGTAIRTLQEYRANGSLYHLANFATGDRKGRLDASVRLRGKWRLQGNRLIETISSAGMRSLSANGQDISDTLVGRIMARDLPKRMANTDRPSRTTIKFISSQEFHMVSGRIKGVCTKR